MIRRRARACAAIACAIAAVAIAVRAGAQVAPNLHWETIKTEHFNVNFAPGLEPVARRAAGSIERAYGRLSKELHEPRGPIDLTIADNYDVSNGYASVFPSNRIVVYARPTVDATSLKFLDDWIDLVVTHELTHIFHLDRTGGWWRAAQYVFGRNPFTFPSLLTPSWLDEGIAVYYESRLTGAGRIVGTDHAMIARAAALEGTTPKLHGLSASTLAYPLGQTAYGYGSLLVDYMARHNGPEKMRAFVDVEAGRTIPFLLDRNAKAGFGASFSDSWREWTDSIRRDALSVASKSTPLRTPLRELTVRGWTAQRLRWIDPSHIIYGSDDGRSLPALREVSAVPGATEKLKRLETRNTLDITSPLSDGSRIVAQGEFVDPYTIRNDLYLEQGGTRRQLTHGARLMQPDAYLRNPITAQRPGTDIVAVQITPGADRLVIVRLNGTAVDITPITTASPDTVWSEPRWSHDGLHIAATRWVFGGESEVVILNTVGAVQASLGRARAEINAPSWSPDDRSVYFTSDRNGRSALYRATVASGALARIAESSTGLFESEPSPDGTQIATLHYRSDGYHVSLVPAVGAFPAADSISVLPPSRNDPRVSSSAAARPYSAWRSLLPTYWLPAVGTSDDKRPMFGFATSGVDVLARHRYELQLTYEPRHQEPNWNFAYQYAGLGNPILGVTTEEDWEHGTVIGTSASGQKVAAGTIARRRRIIDVALSVLRPRVTTNSYFTLGVETEWQDFRTEPRALIAKLDTGFTTVFSYPAFFINVGWSNARQPTLAISPENGVQFAVSAKQQWLSDDPTFTRNTSVIGVAKAFKALDLPGFAHHVLAFRVAAGWEDEKSLNTFSAGGISGTSLNIAPGVTLGDPQRTFFARGFPAGAQRGTRALGANLEYRLPISIPSAGLKMLPVFLQRVSAVAFADAASAWCPYGLTRSVLCANGTPHDWMSSVGAELHIDAAYEYDLPYKFRFGVASPIVGRDYFGGGNAVIYFAVGLPF